MIARGVLLAGALLVACAHAPPFQRAPQPDDRALQERLLGEKAAAFHAAIRARHLTPEGIFLYAVELDRIEARLADGSAAALSDTPMYTGLFAAASCTRASVETGIEQAAALADAERALNGLRLLVNVTGRPGLLARGLQLAPAPPVEARKPTHRWFAGAPGHEQLTWRGDVSHDQYANGLLPALAECRSAFPEQTRALIHDVAELLLANGMQLIDPDGRRTRYGDLSPRAGYGFNSIAKLTGYAVFALAAELDPDPRWSAQRDALRDEDRVVASSTTTNLRIFGITNRSNDLMAWNLYRVLIPLARRMQDPALADLKRGLEKAWRRVREDRNPYFALLYLELSEAPTAPDALQDAREILLRFPLEKRRLAPAPELAAYPLSWLPGRKLHRYARDWVPIELRPAESFEWKSSPYRVAGPDEPGVEYTGLDYLSAYWVYRRTTATP